MNRTVAYQETSNNYTDLRQQIKGAQISTVKNFGVTPPAGGGDFVGQFGISADMSGESLLYVYGVGGAWQLVGKSGSAANLPDEVVMENRANNFTHVDQRIEDCAIMYLDNGTQKPANVAIKGEGHVYVYESNPVQVFISYDGHSWTPIITATMGDVELDKPNNFTNPDQQIQGSNIVVVRKGSTVPDPSVIVPSRDGELYIQVAEGTTDKKARMWISSNAGGWKWEPLTHIFELPDQVAMTSKSNDFQAVDQKIAGKQILSFVDGGDKTPEQSKLPADYDGQFYIAVKNLSAGVKDVSVWVANGNQWLPVAGVANIDDSNYAKLDTSNIFTNPIQLLGDVADTRMITGTRVKRDRSPVADGSWKAVVEGEQTLYINDTVTPSEISLWTAVKVNSGPTNVGEWARTWSSKQNIPDNIAVTDKANIFTPLQMMGGGSNLVYLTGSRADYLKPTGRTVPLAFGESFIHRLAGTNEFDIYMAAEEGDTDSWVKIYQSNWKEETDKRLFDLDTNIRSVGDGLTDTNLQVEQMDHSITDILIEIDKLKARIAVLEAKP